MHKFPASAANHVKGWYW